jgi:O-acetyl-ADP-ribose deacetylase (regulator of RNase III)
MIEIIQSDVLSSGADAVILTIDGTKRGLEGNIARAFARRWPDAWMEIEDEIKYPIPLGRAVAIRPENDSGFSVVLIASTLHHLDALTDARKAGIVRSAFAESIQLAMRHRVRRAAVAPMTGGWRLELPLALEAMMEGLRPIAAIHHSLVVAIHLLSQEHAKQAAEIARSRGIDVQIGADLK